jgi:[calcium/calmodulin-dependent protein kinase] kinase
MKAVQQFKRLISKKRPHFIDDEEIRIVLPPRSMSPPEGSSGLYRSRSLDTEVRRSVEQALSSDVHRDVDVPRTLAHNTDPAVAIADNESDCSKTSSVRSSFGHSENVLGISHLVAHEKAHDSGKGQAQDPLDEDPLYLNVGPGGEEAHLEPSYIVSESPPVTDIDVYETAYREEVERIRQKQGNNATVYLTRRVEAQVGGESD